MPATPTKQTTREMERRVFWGKAGSRLSRKKEEEEEGHTEPGLEERTVVVVGHGNVVFIKFVKVHFVL